MNIRSIKQFLEYRTDNTPLVVFRIAFGFLIAAESFGALLLGWVKSNLAEPQFTFTFIGFEWLSAPGSIMYVYFAMMGILGLLIMTGFYYRYSLGLFTVMWWAFYLMQKSSYNNHYYLMILLCFMMLIVPAHGNASFDVRKNRLTASVTCPRWCIEIFRWQLLIVFTFAALAKLYPGWLQGDFIGMSFSSKAEYPLIGGLLQEKWLQQLVILGGIAYDISIIPLMYWAKTRKFGLIISVFFHLFNSVVFGIGIFPYLMIAALALFFPLSHWQPKIPGYVPANPPPAARSPKILYPVMIVYFMFQLWLPVRHYFIPGNVFKTEEGHRMSWRMMLRSKYGMASFRMVDKKSGKNWVVYPREHLTQKQSLKMGGRPDMIWQFSRFLEKKYAEQGITELEIYADVNAYLNGNRLDSLIEPGVDLLTVEWKRFGHNPWIVID